MQWYRVHARVLPWRGARDPYRIWLSEVMLQQTRVNAAVDHYEAFLRRFPTLPALALASESEVLAAWSGLGYYRRARMLHHAAKVLMEQQGGTLPRTSTELRRLPGIGTYTSAAIASIAFGEPIAVVDGNVERVLLRVLGWPEATGAKATASLNAVAQSLVPQANAGDHNQAMMELGATICLPRSPRCDACPVFEFCRTRGEHPTMERTAMRSERSHYGLTTRKIRGSHFVEVLLQHRPADASLMAGMLELPQLVDPAAGRPSNTLKLLPEPMLRVRHAITGTNYYVEVVGFSTRREMMRRALRVDAVEWVPARELPDRPLTGLTRKVLQRLQLMQRAGESRVPELPLLIGRNGRIVTGDEA